MFRASTTESASWQLTLRRAGDSFKARLMSIIRANEGLRRAILGIDEDDVFGIATRRIDREEHDRLFQQVRHRVNGPFLEEQELPRSELRLRGRVAHPENAAAGEDKQIFVARGVIVRRRRSVNTKDARWPRAGWSGTDPPAASSRWRETSRRLEQYQIGRM